jgi:hypothetical protein
LSLLIIRELTEGLHQLHQLFAAACGIAAGNIDDEDMYLPAGKAVSPIKAAHCLIDIQRTSVFLRGVHKAILQLKSDFPDQRPHILYGGCGPYATLLTPLTTLFKPDELAFHLLDINTNALDAAKKIYDEFGLNDYVEEWICADATTYSVPDSEVRHLMISETMQTALRREPEVDVMRNLVPQLPAKGLFVPAEIVVSAVLMNGRLETDRCLTPESEPQRINLGKIYAIGRDIVDHPDEIIKTIPINYGIFNRLYLLTDINTFAYEKLGIYDSSLTMP